MGERDFRTEIGLGQVRWGEFAGQPANYVIIQDALYVDANELIRALISLPTDRRCAADLTHQQWLRDPNRGPRITQVTNAIEWHPDRKDSILFLHNADSYTARDFSGFMNWIAQQESWDPNSSHPVSLTEDERQRFEERRQWAEQLVPAYEWETKANEAIRNLRDTVTALQGGEGGSRGLRVFNQKGWDALTSILFDAPGAYRGMILELFFENKDMEKEQSWENFHRIEALGIQDSEATNKGRLYHFPVLAPRFADWSSSGFSAEQIAHRGSYVRDFEAQHQNLYSVRYNYAWPDRVTRQNGALEIFPTVNMLGKDTFFVFPRNLLKVTLTEELPDYLDEDQIGAVEAWYAREMHGK